MYSLLDPSLAKIYQAVLWEWRLYEKIGRLREREPDEREEQAGKKAEQIKGRGIEGGLFSVLTWG